MVKKVMAVYDSDPFYADRFADFVNSGNRLPFQVMAFSSLERLAGYAKQHEIEILLISASVSDKTVEEIQASHVVRLSDGYLSRESNSYPSVYKFQSSENIIREVMSCYGEDGKEVEELMFPSGKVLGVYSPVNRCLKTSFALAMGQLLGQEEKTLYVNLEDCSGLSAIMGEMFKGDLSDVLYFYRQGKYNWAKLGAAVYTWGSLDYIPPARYPEDLCQMEAEEMAVFLSEMARSSSYRMIIVDIGQFGRKAACLLEICDVVYMPVKEDFISSSKIEEFEQYLEVSGYGKIREKIRKIKLPQCGNSGKAGTYLEQLVWGEMGDYVREILHGGKEAD